MHNQVRVLANKKDLHLGEIMFTQESKTGSRLNFSFKKFSQQTIGKVSFRKVYSWLLGPFSAKFLK